MDEKGQPLPNILAKAWGCGTHSTSLTDHAGRFHLKGLISGETLQLRACGVDYGPLDIDSVRLDSQPLTIQFHGCFDRTLDIRVMDGEGKSVPGHWVHVVGNHFSRGTFVGPDGRVKMTRCANTELYAQAMAREPELSASLWEVPATAKEVTIAFPSAQQKEAILKEKELRMARSHPVGTRIPLAEHAWLTNPANIGPLPVRDGLWMLRGIKMAGVQVQIPEPGTYRILCRARRIGTDAEPRLKILAVGAESFVTVSSFEWSELTGRLKLETGKQLIQFQLESGWAADIEWVEVRPALPSPSATS